MKSVVHTTLGRFHTRSVGVAEVAEVGARSRARVGSRENLGLGFEMGQIRTEIED